MSNADPLCDWEMIDPGMIGSERGPMFGSEPAREGAYINEMVFQGESEMSTGNGIKMQESR